MDGCVAKNNNLKLAGEDLGPKDTSRRRLEKRNSCRIVRACARAELVLPPVRMDVPKSCAWMDTTCTKKYVRKQRNLLQLDRWIYLRWTDGAIYLAHNCLL